MARGPIFPSDAEREFQQLEREREAIISARLMRTRQKPQRRGEYPLFTSETERDAYLDKLIANCYWVKAKTVDGLFTVENIDCRKGK